MRQNAYNHLTVHVAQLLSVIFLSKNSQIQLEPVLRPQIYYDRPAGNSQRVLEGTSRHGSIQQTFFAVKQIETKIESIFRKCINSGILRYNPP